MEEVIRGSVQGGGQGVEGGGEVGSGVRSEKRGMPERARWMEWAMVTM